MGCTNSMRKQQTQVDQSKHGGNRFQNLFYATTEFDLSASDSENEHCILPNKLMNNNNNKLPNNIDKITTGLSTANNSNDLSTTRNTLIENRLSQTRI